MFYRYAGGQCYLAEQNVRRNTFGLYPSWLGSSKVREVL